MTVLFLPQIGNTTLPFEGLEVEVLVSCYANTREALSRLCISERRKNFKLVGRKALDQTLKSKSQ